MQRDDPNSPAKAPHAADAADPWRAAYLRFETPEQEIRKFIRRLQRIGESAWSRDARIVELFCGRGGGIDALARLGFTRLHGLDISWQLASLHDDADRIAVADCRHVPFAARSMDIAIVQGGLHHLPELPGDLDRTVAEVARILAPGGRFVAVEPWRTPFLDAVHLLSEQRLARRAWPRLDALATMIAHERDTYTAWLNQPALVLAVLRRHFPDCTVRIGMGKLTFVGVRG